MSLRVRHHLVLLVGGVILWVLCAVLAPEDTLRGHLSIATAWYCLTLLSAALVYGPVHHWQRGSRPANDYLRRDMGIWAAMTGLVHFMIATDISMNPVYLNAYVHVDAAGISADIRDSLFSWGSIIGTLAGLVLLVPLLISNDHALRWLGVKRWRKAQWLAYPAFILTWLHGLAFQLLESRALILVLLLTALCLAVLVLRNLFRPG